MDIIRFNPTCGGHRLQLDEIERLANGEARVSARYMESETNPKLMRLSVEERKQFEHAKQVGYHNHKPDKVAWLANYWAESAGVPMIRITSRKKFASVCMDLVSCAYAITEICNEQVDAIEEIARNAKARLRYAGCYTLIERVPLATASEVARRLRDFWDVCTLLVVPTAAAGTGAD